MHHQRIIQTETSQQRADRLLAEYRAGNDNTVPMPAWLVRARVMAHLFAVGPMRILLDAVCFGLILFSVVAAVIFAGAILS